MSLIFIIAVVMDIIRGHWLALMILLFLFMLEQHL